MDVCLFKKIQPPFGFLLVLRGSCGPLWRPGGSVACFLCFAWRKLCNCWLRRIDHGSWLDVDLGTVVSKNTKRTHIHDGFVLSHNKKNKKLEYPNPYYSKQQQRAPTLGVQNSSWQEPSKTAAPRALAHTAGVEKSSRSSSERDFLPGADAMCGDSARRFEVGGIG